MKKEDKMISAEELRIRLKISKRKAAWLLQNQIIPCQISDKGTHKYLIRERDVEKYLARPPAERAGEIPVGLFNSRNPRTDQPEALKCTSSANHLIPMSDEEKEAYEEKFIKTYVTLKNSVLKDSGLFCIGIDSHFSGLLLENGLIAETWTNLARTSYGAKLIIEGDVRMYDWKNINSVNSDTLIETNSSTFEKYKLDVKELINSLATNTEKPNLNKIVYNKEEKDGSVSKYVHGGIAFFGGGKNYGVAEFKDYKFAVLNGYEINLSDVGRTDLQAAAGNESFYFLLNDASIANQSTGFLPENQEELLKSEEAYAPIYIKD